MSEYFHPSKIWVGKLCYVEMLGDGRTLFLPCRISSIVADRRYGIGVVLLGTDIEQQANIKFLFDRIDGQTFFHDVPGGKP